MPKTQMNKGRGRTNKPPPRPPISQPSRLRKYSDEHLAYEVNMLRLAASIRVHSSDPTLRILVAFVNNARVESFAQHLRNLIVFLYPDKFRLDKSDVSAHHFLAARSQYADRLTGRPVLSKSLARAKRRADKELAHLTDERIGGTPSVKLWNFVGLRRELYALLSLFVLRSDPDRLGPKAREAIRNLGTLKHLTFRIGAA